ncbi:MAG: hypothetical protein ACUVQU_03500, partial [Candidatus Bipolaricaulia bacterium]
MSKQLRSAGLILAVLLSLLVLAEAGALDDWLAFETTDLVVHFAREDELPQLKGVDGIGLYLRSLQSATAELEGLFRKAEAFLRVDYDPRAQGAIYLFIYPSLEEYQEATGCLICSANVGGLLTELYREVEDLIRAGQVNPIAVYLTSDSTEYVALHEFTHVLDFSLIPNSPPTFLLEGLATYAGYRLDEVPDEWQLGLGGQFVKLFLEEYGPDLFRDYFARGGYWKFTYEIGASFIAFLTERGGWERFLQFYQDLHSPYDRRERLEALFQSHYGAGLAELEAEWKRKLAGLEVTENSRAAYEFKLDQILARYIFLRPLLADPKGAEELFAAARTLLEGRFNEAAGEALREYLSDPANLLATATTTARALRYGDYLRSYVQEYHRDRPELIQAFEADFSKLEGLYNARRFEEFARLYWELVQ